MTSDNPLIFVPDFQAGSHPRHAFWREEGLWFIFSEKTTVVLCLRCLCCKQVVMNPGVEGVDAAQYYRELGRCICDANEEEDSEEEVARTAKHVDGGPSVYFDILHDGQRYAAIGFRVDESELDEANRWLSQRQGALLAAWEAHCKGDKAS